MERLKASIPENLRTLILSTPFNDLQISTSALAEHFSTSLQFSQVREGVVPQSNLLISSAFKTKVELKIQELRFMVLATNREEIIICVFRCVPQLLEQLTNPNLTVCAKDAEGAATWKRDGNAAFGSQNFDQALSCYTKVRPVLGLTWLPYFSCPLGLVKWFRRGVNHLCSKCRCKT